MIAWLDQLKAVQRAGQRAISVAVASTKGSVPREAGTRMLVTPSDVFGTIGGGNLEFKSIAIARDLLASDGPQSKSLQRFPLGASLGQCCGGLVNLLFEPVEPEEDWVDVIATHQANGTACVAITPVHGHTGKLIVSVDDVSGSLDKLSLESDLTVIARQQLMRSSSSALVTHDDAQYFFEVILPHDFNIVVFGAGHVGRALVKILADLPCDIRWVDSREEEFPMHIPAQVEKRVNDAPEDEVAAARPGSFFVVMTHNHQLDQLICEHIFQRRDHAYFGMIGSLSKRRQFERRLVARGVPFARLDELVCPIGAHAILSKEPMAIAVSVAAEILQRREALQQITSSTTKQQYR